MSFEERCFDFPRMGTNYESRCAETKLPSGWRWLKLGERVVPGDVCHYRETTFEYPPDSFGLDGGYDIYQSMYPVRRCLDTGHGFPHNENLDRPADRWSAFIAPNSQRAVDEAAKLGLAVVFPEPNELQIDIDSLQQYDNYTLMFPILDQYFGIIRVQAKLSHRKLEGRHLTLTLKNPVRSNTERILLQLALGSDNKRELLSYVQELNGDPHPTLFLEKKEE